MNSAYPLVLQPKRKTVDQAQAYCEENQLKFPKVEVPNKDRAKPSDCYVFEGQGDTPTVIHIPLFNTVNCGGDIIKWQSRYSTFKRSYSEEDIKDLLKVAKSNVKRSQETISAQIHRVIALKQQQHGKHQY
ncbi:UNVERIFIED_CONTAM: hypothetical protein FKN15_016745 [Acipenser sinensis]